MEMKPNFTRYVVMEAENHDFCEYMQLHFWQYFDLYYGILLKKSFEYKFSNILQNLFLLCIMYSIKFVLRNDIRSWFWSIHEEFSTSWVG